MLSYRHSFHAGNFADVLKHIVQVEILEHLCKKDKPFDYIDTHAGAGLYNLKSDHAQKLGEYANGIGNLAAEKFPELSSYFAAIDACNPSHKLNFYPGSPLIATHFLRRQDNAWLYELHPKDFELLEKNTAKFPRVKTACQNGYAGLLSKLPPVSRRGLVLIDPSYEVKAEYDDVFSTVEKAYKKFATGTFAIWYPVVDRKRIDRLEQRFRNSGIKDIQRFELGLEQDTDARGMTSSGMIVINPPWGLHDKMSALLPKLALALGEAGKAVFKCDLIAGE